MSEPFISPEEKDMALEYVRSIAISVAGIHAELLRQRGASRDEIERALHYDPRTWSR